MNDATEQAPTLLLVDDEAGILSSLRRALRPSGYRLQLAESGAAGLQVLAREAVDLVISDMRMPAMNGAQFLEKVREGWPDTVRILLTGYADVGSTIDAINRGEIYRYISKPWDDNELLLIVRQALEQKRLRQENERLLALTRQQNDQLKSLNAELEAKVRERTAELARTNDSLKLANVSLRQHFLVTIKTFSALMEMRSGGVAGHARRVADLARKLAGRLKLEAGEQQDVFLAGLLHDVGKIGFTDALLAKPVSAMNGEELARYRRHAADGANAMAPLEELKNAAAIVRAHHERFDGQGFPTGLSGMMIPVGARILSVINDYDGLQHGILTERRFSADDAKEMIVKSRGKRHDPMVVDALLEMLGGVARDDTRDLEVSAADLQPGMVMARDLLGRDGTLLLAADYILDASLVRQIQQFAEREGGALRLHVRGDKQ